MTPLAILGWLWWAACLALLAGSALLALVQPRLVRRRAVRADAPPVSAIVPLHRHTPTLPAATASLAAQDPQPAEVLLAARPIDAPALEAALAAVPGLPCRACRTEPAPGNPKAANLRAPVAAARFDIVLMKDAETVLPPGALAAMLRALTPGVGLVCAVPVARGAEGLAAAVEAVLINGYGARLLLALSALGGGAGIGAAMLVRRADLDRAQGLDAMAASVADDHALALALRRIGLRTVFAETPVFQALGRRDPAEVWRRHRRWAVCRRQAAPLAFALEPCCGLAAAVAAALLAQGWPLALASLLAWPAAEGLFLAARGWGAGPATVPAILLREALAPLLWLSALLAAPPRRDGAVPQPSAGVAA